MGTSDGPDHLHYKLYIGSIVNVSIVDADFVTMVTTSMTTKSTSLCKITLFMIWYGENKYTMYIVYTNAEMYMYL